MMANVDLREGLPAGYVPNQAGDVFFDEKANCVKVVVLCHICRTPVSLVYRGTREPTGTCMACAMNLRREA